MSTAWITLAGAHNVRDLGGLPATGGRTRPGVLLRSDGLDALTAADVAHLVEDHGLRHVIDLRTDRERIERGRGLLGATGAVYSELDAISYDDLMRRREPRAALVADGDEPVVIMAEGYSQLLELGATAFATALRTIVAPGGSPVVVHCSAGKDRTGVLVALLLDAAGVERSAIVADYAATNDRMGAIIERLHGAAVFQDLSANIPAFAFEAQAETMERFLDNLSARWGSAAGYFEAHGVSDTELAMWQAQLVKP